MSDTATGHGDNGADHELKRRIRRRVEILDEIAEHQETLKGYKAEDKADGYEEKALAAVAKAVREADPEKHANQIRFESVVDTYRAAAGLPTDQTAAFEAARKASEELPEPDGNETDGDEA